MANERRKMLFLCNKDECVNMIIRLECELATKTDRLESIARIIEEVDHRASAADGTVTPTLQEMTSEEISAIYRLARQASTKDQETP